MFQGSFGIRQPLVGFLELAQKDKVVAPRQLCNSLLHNCFVGPGLRERSHVLQVSFGESPHVPEGLPSKSWPTVRQRCDIEVRPAAYRSDLVRDRTPCGTGGSRWAVRETGLTCWYARFCRIAFHANDSNFPLGPSSGGGALVDQLRQRFGYAMAFETSPSSERDDGEQRRLSWQHQPRNRENRRPLAPQPSETRSLPHSRPQLVPICSTPATKSACRGSSRGLRQ